MNSFRKNPFTLLTIPPGLHDREELKRLARRKRKELLAEFDLHNLPSLTIHGESWLKSEVPDAIDPLIEEKNHPYFTIIRQGWGDFWSGDEEIPPSLFALASLSLEDIKEIKAELGELLLQRITEALRINKIETILSLLRISEQLTPMRQEPIDRAVRKFLNEEAVKWTLRIMMPLTSFRKSEIRKWFPMRAERLICQLPPRFNRSTTFLAKERLWVCDYVAPKFSRKQRKIFIPACPSNPSWNPEFKDRWDSYEQSLLSLPREKLANTELSPWAAIGIGISVFASLFISGILLDNNPRPIRPFNSSLLLDSIHYEPSFEWNFIDTSELMKLPNKDSFFSELTPPPPLPEISPVEWPEPLDSITYERLGQLQDLIDSFRAINDSLSSNIPQDTTILGSDSLTIPDSAQGQAPTSQSTP